MPGESSRSPSARRFVATRVEVEGREETRVVELPQFEPEPWQQGARLTIVGQRVPRADALEKVTGAARYTTDVQRPGMLYAAILRATIPRGSAWLDADAARLVPGVRDVVTGDDIPHVLVQERPLFERTVRYAGQPLAAACAETPEAAERAVRAIRVRYEVQSHAVTTEAALAPGAPRVMPNGNLAEGGPQFLSRGDVERGLAAAEVVVRREYRTPVALHTALEPHSAVAEWEGDRLTVWESTQGIFNTRSDLAAALELPLTKVRVVQDCMGGGFGAKNGASANAFIAALLARRVGRPVRCVNDRAGEQRDAGNRPGTIQRVTLGAKRDGSLTAIALDADITMGAGGWLGGPARIFHELYSCPNVRTTERFVYVNAGAMSSFRAPGHVEGAFGLECAMDALARELGMDPLELRRRNLSRRNESNGRAYSTKHLDDCYRVGAERFGWAARRNGAGDRGAARVRRGYGMASQTWGGGGGPPAYAMVRINGDGTCDVLTGTQDLGTGARTVFAQIAAESLGARLDDVRVVLGDTERTPYTGNSWGSMTVASVGPAVRMAAEDARAQLLEAAAGMLDVEPNELEAHDGMVRVKQEGRCLTFAEIGKRLGDVMILGRGARGPNPEDMSLATFGAQFAEVEVNLDTGMVQVRRMVSVHDCGRIINPMLAESQLEGGVLQGMGYALFEERVMDQVLGVQLNANMHDYKIPTLADVPRIDAIFLDIADPVANHIGARGVGEPPIIPTAPAIANAVANAIGRDVLEIPLTPWRVLVALGSGDRRPPAGSSDRA
jgi:xanthine dehydrogenase YagR molybdenum-binding subunit